MKLLSTFGAALSGRSMQIAHHLGAAFVAALLFGMVQRFTPFFAPPVALAAIGVIAFLPRLRRFRLGMAAFVVMSSFYFLLTQPMLALALSIACGVAAGAYAAYRAQGWKAKVGIALVSGVSASTFLVGVTWVLLVYVLPVLHVPTVPAYNWSPLVVAWLSVLVVLYYSWRSSQVEEDERKWHWLATPIMATLFIAWAWPVHSYVAQAVAVSVGLGLSFVSWYCRPKIGVAALTAAASCFTALFALSAYWTGFNEFQQARALQVEYSDVIPNTADNRMVPRIAATDYCAQQNRETFVELSSEPHIIVLPNEKGERKFYWQCLRHPSRLRGHLLYATGGVDGIILADAGERGRSGMTVEAPFFFGDASQYTLGAFAARHPGSEMQSPLAARSTDGDWYILVPYTSRVMQWGAMIPDLSGVMVVSRYGFIQDYTPEQAARKFPDVALMPSELARHYAEIWGRRRTLHDLIWFGDLFEVSEFNEGQDAINHYPFWQDFEDGVGLRGVIPFEPVGAHQNVVAGIGLFDPHRLRMTFVDSAGTRGPGPKQIAANVAVSHPGLFNVRTIEALLVVRDGQVYWLTGLINPQKQALHGYGYNIAYDRNAQSWCDVDSKESLRRCIENMRQGRASTSPSMSLPSEAGPPQPPPAQQPQR